MSYDQFWRGQPSLVKYYRDANAIRAKRVNTRCWLMGEYIVHAMNASVGNMFLQKGAAPIKYLEEPLPLTQKDVDEYNQRKADEAEERLKAALMQWAAQSSKKKEGGHHG